MSWSNRIVTRRSSRNAERRRRRGMASVAIGVTTGLILAAGAGGAAFAAPGDVTEAEGLFLSGGGAVNLDSIAQLAGPYNAAPPGATVSAPLDVSALGLIDLGLGVQLFGGNDVLTLGATGQYARTDTAGSFASSGLIDGTGAIQAGTGAPGENTTLDLGPVSQSLGLTALLSDASLELGALSSSAESTRVDGDVDFAGDYQIANGELVLTSPVLGTTLTALDTRLDTASASVNALTGTGGAVGTTVNGLLGGIASLIGAIPGVSGLVSITSPVVTTTVNIDLDTALDTISTTPYVSGPVTLTLGTGQIVVDLDELYALNNMPENSQIISDLGTNPTVVAALSDILTNQLPTALQTSIRNVLNSTAMTVNVQANIQSSLLGSIGTLRIATSGTVGGFLGTPGSTAPTASLTGTTVLGLPLGAALTPVTNYVVGTIVPGIGTTVGTALNLTGLQANLTTTLTNTITALQPVLAAVNQLVSVLVNVTEQPGTFRDPDGEEDANTYTKRAVQIEVAPAVSAIVLNLASATVWAAPLDIPGNLAIVPDRGPVTGGTPVTITGDNLDDVTGITFGSVPVGGFTVNLDGSVSTVAPPQTAPGPVTVTVTNPDGSDSSLTFEYFPVTAVDLIDPASGPTAGSTSVTITGVCLTGTTSVLFGGTPGTALNVISDTELTVTTPAGAAGPVDVEIVNPTECGGVVVDDGFSYVAPGAPTLTLLDPDRGPETGGTLVTITGDDFTGTTSVTFDGVAAPFTVVNDNEITATAPAHAPATVGVIVTNAAGASAPLDYEYYDVTDIASVDPTQGPETGGNTVTIIGSCFTGATDVFFGGTSATSFTVVSDTEISAVVPAGTGLVDVSVVGVGDCGTGTLDDAYTFVPAPIITDLDPTEGLETGGTVVTITGTGLTGTTGVTFDGIAGTALTVISDTELEITTPAHAPGVAPVVVQHPGGDTAAGDFTFLNVPTVTAVDPTIGPDEGGTVVTITGEGFTGSTGVTFDGLPGTSFTVVSDTEITVTTPAHAPGTAPIVVQHPVADASAGGFLYIEGTVVDAIDPTEGPAAGGTAVTITGSCFLLAGDVLFDGISATSFTIVSDTEIQAVTPAGTGLVDVTVVGSPLCGSGTLDDAFTYIAPPVIVDVDPTEGPETGGTVVTITGIGLTGTTGVTFDGLPGTALNVVSDTEVQVTTPAHAPGLAAIVVQHPGGDTAAGDFTYLNVPTVTDADPRIGPDEGGTVVTITGEGFTGSTGVTFDGAPGTAFTVVSDTEITVTTPPHTAATVPIVVLNPVADAPAGDFTYIVGTIVDEVDPGSGPDAGGTVVTITGACFTDAADVLFGGTSATSFTVVSDTEISAIAPAGTGLVDVTVVGSATCGSGTLDDAFVYIAPPVITDLDPIEGPETGGTVVTITGTGLLGSTAVTFDGIPGTALNVVSDTELQVTTPVHAPATVPVVVFHPGGDTAAGDFTFLDVPTVTDVDPRTGPDDGGTVVTITGEGLTGSTGVTFDGLPGTAFAVVSDTEITVTTPAHVPATVPIVIQHPVLQGDAGDFTYVTGTDVSAVDPSSGPEGGGDVVTITGVCFTGAANVLFGGSSATSFTVVSDTEITAVTPTGAGLVDVTVVGSAICGTDTLDDAYTYIAPPVISDLDPVEGPETGGTLVTITGIGLTGTTGVTFDGLPGTGLTVVSDTEIEISTPAHAPGLVSAVVQHPGGDVAAGGFTYLDVPTVTDVDPRTGPDEGGTVVTITGEGFTGSTGVTFDGLAGTAFTVVSDTEISVTTPAHAPGLAPIVVQHPVTDAAAGDFTYVVGTLVDEVDPGSGPEAGSTVVTITGSCFTGATQVLFGATAATSFTVVSDTEISAIVPAGTGVVDVTVVGSAICGTGDLPDGYEYVAPPVISDVDPTEGPETGGTLVTITGIGLTGTTGVTFDGIPGTTLNVISDTELEITTPAHAPGVAPVVIQHPGGDTAAGDFTFLNVPTVTDADPRTGPDDGGTVVTITGEGFTGSTGVTFDGVPGTAFTVVSDTEITVTTPAHVPATVPIVVLNPVADAPAGDFTYVDGTLVDAVDPDSGPEAGGNTVTITGVCFTGATDVLFGGTSATSFTVVSDTEITAVAPAGVGTVDVTVVGSAICGTGELPDGYEYVAPPVIADVDPTEGPETGGTLVTITGIGLTGTTGVTFDGIPGTGLTVVSDTEVEITTPAHAPGLAPIVVQHPGGDTAAGDFAYLNVPTVTDVDPRTGPDDGGTIVTVTGEGFTGSTGVTFDGLAGTAFTVVSDTEITVTTPAHAPATVPIVILNPVANASAGDFTYVEGTTIGTVDPDAGPETGGTVVTITGVCFTGATQVLFGGTPATAFTVVSDTEISAIVPAGTGVVDVTVVGSAICGTGDLPDGYTYVAPPVISDVDPTEGPETGGTVVTITGTGLTETTGVTFDGLPGTGLTVISDTEIQVTTPAHAPGLAAIVVEHLGGDTAADDFTYLNVPSVTDVDPRTGLDEGGTVVTITGEGFTGSTGVTFDGLAGTAFTVVSDTEITVTTPAHVPATVPIVILNPVADAPAGDFTYIAGTTIDEVDPPSGPEDGGNTVTITGVCFTGATQVLFGSTPATSFTVVSDTQITAVVPAGTGTTTVSVIGAAACGTGDLPDGYEYVAPPVVGSLTPTVGPETGGTVVTITGTGLTGTTGVTFDGTPGTALTVVSDTEVRVTTPPHAPATVPVVVQHPGGDTAAGPFEYLDIPSIASLTPPQGPEDGGTVVTVLGEGFTGATGVTFDGIAGTAFTVVSDTEITVTTPPHAPAAVAAVVTHPNGDSPDRTFTYVAGTEIESITPPAGPEAGGTTVTILGSCFTGATEVRFGTAPAEFEVVSDTEIRAVAPAGTGVVSITVVGSAACGTDTAVDAYEYTDAPVIVGLTPDFGPESGGTVVTITGVNLDGTTAVTFDGDAGVALEVVDDTEIRVTTPAHAPGATDVLVMSDGGTSDPAVYTFIPGEVLGGTSVRITGECFTGATAVLFDGIPSPEFVVIDDSTIIAVTPEGVPDDATATIVGTRCGDIVIPGGGVPVGGSGSGGALPATGSDVGFGVALLGLGLLAAGGAAVIIRRRLA